MSISRLSLARRTAGFVVAAGLLIALGGCVSSYNNSQRFTLPPHPGMTELEMLQKYGAPDYAGFVEEQKVYIYKVRESGYFIIFGRYSGRDIVVTTKGGVVKKVDELSRGESLTFLYAAPWMGHD